MELAFLTLLLKDGADSIHGGVAINHKWVLKTGLSKDGGHANGVDKCLERGLVFVFPVKFATFSAESDKRVKGGGQEAEVSNVHAVKIEESQERA